MPDGIAGMFRNNAKNQEVVYKNRKGVAKLALENGMTIIPAYCVGTTKLLTLVYDPWDYWKTIDMGPGRGNRGIFFWYHGRYFLPIPRRANLTLLISEPIEVQKVEKPTQEDIDALHSKILTATKTMYYTHRKVLGYENEELIFVEK